MKTGLKIVSVLMLILGVFTLATGVLDIVMLSNTGSDGVAVKALMGLAFILLVLSGLLDVIGGLLGLRAANDSGKATGGIVNTAGGIAAAIVFGLLALLAGLGTVAMEVNAQNICACVLPAIYFICAIAVKGSR